MNYTHLIVKWCKFINIWTCNVLCSQYMAQSHQQIITCLCALCVFSGAFDVFHTRFYLIMNIINVACSDLFKVKVRNIISLDQREIWKVKRKDAHTHTHTHKDWFSWGSDIKVDVTEAWALLRSRRQNVLQTISLV